MKNINFLKINIILISWWKNVELSVIISQEKFYKLQVYESTSIWSFHNLVTHHGLYKQAPELMMQSLAAIFLLRCLKAKDFYPKDPKVRLILWTQYFNFYHFISKHMYLTFYLIHESKWAKKVNELKKYTVF